MVWAAVTEGTMNIPEKPEAQEQKMPADGVLTSVLQSNTLFSIHLYSTTRIAHVLRSWWDSSLRMLSQQNFPHLTSEVLLMITEGIQLFRSAMGASCVWVII